MRSGAETFAVGFHNERRISSQTRIRPTGRYARVEWIKCQGRFLTQAHAHAIIRINGIRRSWTDHRGISHADKLSRRLNKQNRLPFAGKMGCPRRVKVRTVNNRGRRRVRTMAKDRTCNRAYSFPQYDESNTITGKTKAISLKFALTRTALSTELRKLLKEYEWREAQIPMKKHYLI